MAELADSRLRRMLKPVIELLAGIPSVVYGFFGLVAVVPLVRDVFDLPVGETALAGSLILAIMALPTIITVAEDTIRTTPRAMRESSLALGATHWQTIRRVVLPYSASGIAAAAVLGIGRAVGETMAGADGNRQCRRRAALAARARADDSRDDRRRAGEVRPEAPTTRRCSCWAASCSCSRCC